MREEFKFKSADGKDIHAYKWPAQNPKAVLQISHGAVEHALRFDALACALVVKGISVYAEDHLGHGKTAGTPENVGHLSDSKGAFRIVVEDMRTLTKIMKEENPGAPVFMLGHSMGSMLTRIYAAKYGDELSGVIVTGTGGKSYAYLTMMMGLAKMIMLLRGKSYRSPKLNGLYDSVLNGPFGGGNGNEFLCSNPEVVAAYNADEYCGNPRSAEYFYELLWGTREAAVKRSTYGFPKKLPLFIGAGEFDSLGGKGLKEVKNAAEAYRKAGVLDLTFNMYPGMRHEILNETGKQQVWNDIIGWLEKHIKV
jgi:alpha-beta hydrolase superfamily lysophospholipase